MFEYDERRRYDHALGELMREFDKYLQGMWKEIDYERHNARSTFKYFIEGTEERVLVSFGDSNTSSEAKPRLLIAFKKAGFNLEIIDIEFITFNIKEEHHEFSKESNGAYSSEVLSLIGYTVLGKTNKDLAKEDLEVLEEQRRIEGISIHNIAKDLKHKRANSLRLLREIQKLENNIKTM